LVSSIRQQLEQKAAARRLKIQAKIPPEMEIRTEPARLRSILTNLLNNAVQYSRPDGAVQIQGEGQNGRFTLSVTNPVESLRPEDLPHLFERFWRKDAARSGGEHFGLGLSLARAFASSLGFTLNATFDRDGRLRMTLAGPVDSEDSTGDNFDGKTNSRNRMNHKQLVVLGTLGLAFACTCQAGTELKWKDVPESVRATVLANGGVEGQTVDRENGKKNGMAFYEASVKDKDGSVADLVITEDGKLVETKHDDTADRAAELAAKSDKKPKAAGTVLTMGKFSHPRDIYNPYLPLAYLKQDILDGSEDGKKTHVVRTLLPDKHKTFTIHGQSVEALVMEDRAFEDGQLAEVATDYFAQDDFGTVFYLGEDVDEYESGKLTSHNGPDAWMLGKDTQTPGIIMPAHPKVGDKFKSEDVSREINENDEVISLSATVTVPAGTFNNCVEIKETLADGKIEHKYYAPRVGVVREAPSSGDELLISHTTR
jgi:hypothetical protein